MWPFTRRTEHRQAGYSDGVVAALLSRASGTHADPAATAAVEAAAGALSRAFASADVTPLTPATRGITPDVLAQVGRSLIVRGEIVLIITVREGQVLLPPAASWDVTGTADSTTWRYRCDLAGPSGSTTIARPADGVVHCRYSTDPARPWVGVGPLERARLSGRLSAELEAALGDEASGTRGYLLPVPTGGQDDSVSDLRRDIGSLGGKVALVETVASGWGDGRMAAPRGDYEPKRLGANPPVSLATLRSDAAQAVLSACGVPVELVTSGDGTGQREAWRRSCTAACSRSRRAWPPNWPRSSIHQPSRSGSTSCSRRICLAALARFRVLSTAGCRWIRRRGWPG